MPRGYAVVFADPATRSTEWQPVHPHDREELLTPAQTVPVEIEIWPSGTSFSVGETLRIVVQGADIYIEALPNLPFARMSAHATRGITL